MITITPNPRFLKRFPSKVRKVWHDALLSTDAKQLTKGMLSYNQYGTYQCCLMVAHLAFGGDAQGYTQHSLPQKDSPVWQIFNEEDPDIALRSREGHSYLTDILTSASACNDEFELSFAEIAQLVYPNSHLYGRVSFQRER